MQKNLEITITLYETAEMESVAAIEGYGCTIFQTMPQPSSSDSLRIVGRLLQQMPVDVLYSVMHNVTLNKDHPKVHAIAHDKYYPNL